MLTPQGICRPPITTPSEAVTRRASGIVKTGVMRKFSLTHCRRYGSEASTSANEYAARSSVKGGSWASSSATHFASNSGACSKWYKRSDTVALVVCVPAMLVGNQYAANYLHDLYGSRKDSHETERFCSQVSFRQARSSFGVLRKDQAREDVFSLRNRIIVLRIQQG